MTFPNFLRYIQRSFKDNYNSIDESGALRWLKPGFMQFIFNFPMLAIGYHFRDVETCSIDDISEVLERLGGVMTISGLIHIIFGLLTHWCNGKGCFKLTTWAWTTVPIFSTYWVIVIGTGIAQFALQCKAYPVFFGTWPCEAMPSVDYDDKFAENFCEKAPFMIAFGLLAFDMIIGCLVILYGWIWTLFNWCGLCCYGCDNPNAYQLCTTFEYRQCFNEILQCFSNWLQPFKRPNVRTYPDMSMNDIPDNHHLIN